MPDSEEANFHDASNRDETYRRNLGSRSPPHHPKRGVSEERPEQPADRARSHGCQTQHQKRVQPKDVDVIEILLAEDTDAGASGAQGTGQGEEEIVMPSFAPKLEVVVP